MDEHPSFVKARSLPQPWCNHFPKSSEEARSFQPVVRYRALATRVLVVAKTRIECAWSAYCDAVPGYSHGAEVDRVLSNGSKLIEAVARVLFPEFKDVPYAH